MGNYGGYSPDSYNKTARKRVGKTNTDKDYKKETVKDVLRLPILEVPEQSITKRVAQYLKIRSAVSPADGKTIVATYYPSYDKYGKLTGFKKRDWTIPKEEKFHFTTVGVVKDSNQLFGQKQASMGNNKKLLTVCEGEGDLCAVIEVYLMNLERMARSTNKSLKDYAQAVLKGFKDISNGAEAVMAPTIPVVSLNCGCAAAVNSIANNEKYVKSYDKLVIAFDNDAATATEQEKNIIKGVEATDRVAGFLLSDNIHTFQYPTEVNDPEGYKDLRDMFDAKLFDEIYKGITKCDRHYVPDKLISLGAIDIKDLRKKKKDGVPLPEMPNLFDMTRGPRKGELWTLTGPSGAGKSTISKKIEYAIIEYLRNDDITKLEDYSPTEKCALIHLEEDEEETANGLYAEELQVDSKAFVAEPEKFLTEEEHLDIHDRWIKEDKVRVFDHFGSIPIETLMQKLKQMVFLDDCKWIVLDHLSMVISGLKITDERKALDLVMTELAAFCKQYDVFILAISHMKRKELTLPKGEDQTFWYPVRKEDLRGSAALEQLSWIVLGVEPEELPDRSRGRCRIVSLKNRPHKKLGIADTFWMDENDRLIDASQWEFSEGEFIKHQEF